MSDITILKNRRLESGRTLSELSRAIGIHYSLICQIERGSTKAPVKWQSKISEALGVSVEDIFLNGFAREEER